MLCYHAKTVVQEQLLLPQVSEEMGSQAVWVTGMWRAIWGLSFQERSVEASVPSYIAGSCVLFQVVEKTV